MSTTEELTRRQLWSQTRLVVLDTETTGLESDARIVSIALFIVENGVTVNSWSTLVNPGGHIGATHIHGLDATKLANAKSFATYAKPIRTLLRSDAKTTYLVGQNVGFDVGRLTHEYRLLDQDVPEMLLLDTKRLGPLVGVGSWSNTLSDFATALGLSNPAPHDATADALTVREVVLRFIEKLIAKGVWDLAPYAVLPSASVSHEDDDDALALDLAPEHWALHAEPLVDKATRDKALAQCLAWSCPLLHRRIEDGVTDAAVARSLLEWSLKQLARRDLSRFQRGLLVAGALRAIRGRRQLLVKPKPDLMANGAQRVLEAEPSWGLCADGDQCDKCAKEKADDCRFVVTPTRLMWVALFTKDNQVPLAVAEKYLFGISVRPIGKGSTYEQFRALHADAALRGALVAARTLRSLGQGSRALAAVKTLWGKGLRGPGLTELYAAIEEDNPSRGALVAALERARDVCDEGLSTSRENENWNGIEDRRTRLERRLNRTAKAQPKNPRNTRPPHRTRFVRP